MKIYPKSTITIFLCLFLLAINSHADVRDPERTQGLATPAPIGESELISLKAGASSYRRRLPNKGELMI